MWQVSEIINVRRFWASGRALVRESPMTLPEPSISRCWRCLQVRIRYSILAPSNLALQLMTALSSVYFDRLRCIFNDCRLTLRRAVLVSNVVHNLGDASNKDFHDFETAKQILPKLVKGDWRVSHGLYIHPISHLKMVHDHLSQFKRQKCKGVEAFARIKALTQLVKH